MYIVTNKSPKMFFLLIFLYYGVPGLTFFLSHRDTINLSILMISTLLWLYIDTAKDINNSSAR